MLLQDLQRAYAPSLMGTPPFLDHPAQLDPARRATEQAPAGRNPLATNHPAQEAPHFALAEEDKVPGLQADDALKQQVSRVAGGGSAADARWFRQVLDLLAVPT